MPLGNNTSSTSTSVATTTATSTVTTSENLPDITLVVEDGSGISNANVFCDLDYAIEYCVMKGYSDFTSATENEQKIHLIRGTEFVNNYFEWKGRRKVQSQALAFPRVELYDIDRFEVNGIPEQLKKACIEAGYLSLSSGNDTLFSTKDENGNIKKQKVDSLEVEYFEKTSSSSTQIDYSSIYDVLNKLLKGLYKTEGDGSKISTPVIHTGW